MNNVVLDVNIILDYFSETRREQFTDSVVVFDKLKEGDIAFISSSSFDNIAYLKADALRIEYGLPKSKRRFIVKQIVRFLLSNFKVAKTPAYIEMDFDDIEDSQIISSAKAVDAHVITRDTGMLKMYPDIAITAQTSLNQIENQKQSIDFANLKKQYFDIQPQIEQQMDEVLNATSFIMGDKVKQLETGLQEFTQAKHAITCSSGTDALLLAMMAMDIQPGDEIITTAFTFIATAETIALMKAVPVFVDIEEETLNIDASKIEAAITSKTKAIMPVSLYGQPPDMDEINATAQKHNLKVIIDGAQSFGATYKQKMEVHHCDIFTTSFFPAKPLGCYGDGGAVFTNCDEYAEKIKMMRVHGQNKRYHHKYIGMGGRLDTLQAAILLAKLPLYTEEISMRQTVAENYTSLITANPPLPPEEGRGESKGSGEENKIKTPSVKSDRTSVWAQYTIRVNNRDAIQEKLKQQGVPTAVHYPMPLHKQECFQYLHQNKVSLHVSEQAAKEVMSLPMNPYITTTEQETIIKELQE